MIYGRKITASINPNNVSVENGSNKFYSSWVFLINVRNYDIITCLCKGIILGYKHFFLTLVQNLKERKKKKKVKICADINIKQTAVGNLECYLGNCETVKICSTF